MFVDGPRRADLPRLGPALERHPLFPRRTNVQFARVEAPASRADPHLGARRGRDPGIGQQRVRGGGGLRASRLHARRRSTVWMDGGALARRRRRRLAHPHDGPRQPGLPRDARRRRSSRSSRAERVAFVVILASATIDHPARMTFVTRLRPELIAIAPPWHGFRDTVAGLVGDAGRSANAMPAAQEHDAVRAVLARETRGVDRGPRDRRRRPARPARAGCARPSSPSPCRATGLYEPVPTVAIRIVGLVLSPPGAEQRSPPHAGRHRHPAALAGAARGPAQRSRPAGRAPGPRSPRALGASRVTRHVRLSCRGALQPLAWRRGLDEPSRDRLDRARAAA